MNSFNFNTGLMQIGFSATHSLTVSGEESVIQPDFIKRG